MERLWSLEREDPFIDGPAGYGDLAGARRAARRVGAVAFAAVGEVAERSRVRVRGRVRVLQGAAPGFLSDARCAWRRTELEVELLIPGGRSLRWWYRENRRRLGFYRDQMESFELIDGAADPLEVDVTSARLLAQPRSWFRRVAPAELVGAVSLLPGWVTEHGLLIKRARVRERLLRDGDVIEVVGTVSRSGDPSGTALGRTMATRPVLVAGEHGVLVVP